MPASLLNNLEAPDFYGEKILHGSLSQDANPGPEKSSSTPGDWTAGANWAFAGTVCTHTAGATATLSRDTSEVANEIYRVIFPVASRTAGSVTMSIGGVSGTARSTNETFTEFITATGTGNLTFTPSSDFDGNIDIASVSVKRVAVVAADRVTMWAGDRLSAGVAQAGDAGLFVRSEDGTLSFIGDRVGIGTAEPGYRLDVISIGSSADIRLSSNSSENNLRFYSTHTSADARNWAIISQLNAYGDFGIYQSTAKDGDPGIAGVARMYLTANGTLLINATAAYADNGELLEVNKSADDGGIALFCWSTTDAERALLEFHKSASATIGTKALVADEEAAGGIIWKVADGAVNWSPIASIEGYVDTTPGAGDTGGRLVFSTTADGAASVTERMRIDSAGRILWPTNTILDFGSANLQLSHSDGILQLSAANAADNSGALNQLFLAATNALAADMGGRITFGSKYTAGGAYAHYAAIAGRKENATDGEYGGYLQFSTRTHGASEVERLRIDSTGMARFLAGNIKVANATDGGTGGMHIRSKRAVSAAMSSGTTANIATQIPSGAMILGASFNVDTAITGATSWAAAFNTGSTTALVTGQAVTLNTKANKLVVPEIATAATDITITGSGGDFTAGVIEALVYYIDQTSMANA